MKLALAVAIVLIHSMSARGCHLSFNQPILISPNCPTHGWSLYIY